MGTHVAPAAAIWPSRILVGLIAVTLGVALVLGVSLATRAISFNSPMTDGSQGAGTNGRSHLAAGYPAHYGLAGPSRVGSSVGSWIGYPSHYGLAGPSRVQTITAPIGIGVGYPAHYGLAGPSQFDQAR
jgi:hypothetical protein